jgi:hypothetical protein
LGALAVERRAGFTLLTVTEAWRLVLVDMLSPLTGYNGLVIAGSLPLKALNAPPSPPRPSSATPENLREPSGTGCSNTVKRCFHCTQYPQKVCKNARNAHRKRTEALGFSCFRMVLTGRLLEISQVKPRHFSSASFLSPLRPAIPGQNSIFRGLITIAVLQVEHFFRKPIRSQTEAAEAGKQTSSP